MACSTDTFSSRTPAASEADPSRYCHTQLSFRLPAASGTEIKRWPGWSCNGSATRPMGNTLSTQKRASRPQASAGVTSHENLTLAVSCTSTCKCKSASPSPEAGAVPRTKAKAPPASSRQPRLAAAAAVELPVPVPPMVRSSCEKFEGQLCQCPTTSSGTPCWPGLHDNTIGMHSPPSGLCVFGWQGSQATLSMFVPSNAADAGLSLSQITGARHARWRERV
mmetsp:Transcript_121256/g.387459  ORF Transcript_121256/g.387459 Transcript_121256/m.387459 type:complete len:222 (+) Transcript_121256:1234-1899(+)